MDFSWSPAQRKLYDDVLQATQKQFTRATAPTPEDPFWTREQWQLCGRLGLLGLSVPQAFGGGGFDALTTAYALEAFGQGCEDTGLVFSAAAHLFACAMPIAENGTLAHREHLLPGLCSGELIGANAITEIEAGSDAFALKTRATLDGSMYILNGTKSYVSNGPVADVFVIYASTNPSHGYLGVSAFLVERDTPGLSIGPPLRKVGLTSTPACQVTLDECRVPEANLLGEADQGARIFKQSMRWERACLFALYVGVMQRQLQQATAYALERRQFGKPLIRNQAIAHRLADMKVRLESARLLLYRACWLFDRPETSLLDLEISLSKLAISEAAIQSGLDAIQIHGAVGITVGAHVEHMLRDALPGTIFSGTSEIQRNSIVSELEHEFMQSHYS